MPLVTMTSRATCSLCGCRMRGLLIAPVRINKSALKVTGVALSARDRSCPECGFESNSAPEVYRLEPESQRLVDAARAKKGWA